MPDTGIELGADLYQLWRAGREDLPAVADVYRTAARDLQRVQHDEDVWSGLQQQFGGILTGTAGQLDSAGRALCTAALEYAKADAVAAGELRRLTLAGER